MYQPNTYPPKNENECTYPPKKKKEKCPYPPEKEKSSISFFSSYRPALPLDIFSCTHEPTTVSLAVPMTDGHSYNYRGQAIPKESLKLILENSREEIVLKANADDVDSGSLTGLIFGSERDEGIETLHIGLSLDKGTHTPEFQAISISKAFGTPGEVRLEDSGTFVNKYLVYISTITKNKIRRQPWTAVYRTDLITGKTIRLTPVDEADLSPSVSPSGKTIAVASFQDKRNSNDDVVGWDGEIEDLQTDIWLMDLKGSNRKLYIKNGGWPTWGSDKIIFFHRKSLIDPNVPEAGSFWGVYRANISNIGPLKINNVTLVTPFGIDAMTPAAINETTVVVAIIREKSTLQTVERTPNQYRHIEIFDTTTGESKPITRIINEKESHFDPFVLDNGNRIGYTTTRRNFRKIVENLPPQELEKVKNPLEAMFPYLAKESVELYRTQGVFPTISPDGSKLAFVDNEFENVWLVDGKSSPRMVYQTRKEDNVFGPVWDPDPRKDTLYVCLGPSFKPKEEVQIIAIENVSIYDNDPNSFRKKIIRLVTTTKANNAFPSPNPKGSELVFRSTRAGIGLKNLYVIKDRAKGEDGGIRQITNGNWIDTQPRWSPSGELITFASNRSNPDDGLDQGIDSGYFAVYILKASKPEVVVRVMYSRDIDFAGHVNHPFFHPDENKNLLVVTSDVAGVSVDPISLPLFEHSVRPYGDIFIFEIDTQNFFIKPDVKEYTRITHSRYENSTPIWSLNDIDTLYKKFRNRSRLLGHAKCPFPSQAFSFGNSVGAVVEAEEEKEKEEMRSY